MTESKNYKVPNLPWSTVIMIALTLTSVIILIAMFKPSFEKEMVNKRESIPTDNTIDSSKYEMIYAYVIDLNMQGELIDYTFLENGAIQLQFTSGEIVIRDKQNDVLMGNSIFIEKQREIAKQNMDSERGTTNVPNTINNNTKTIKK